jgi:hypothetical protein
MKKVIAISVLALLAACGSTTNDGSGGSTGSVAEATDDTVTVDDFGDMPAECVDLLASFLRKIEPTVSSIDWDEATLADFEAFGEEFEADSTSFDAQISAAGCNRYSLSGSDDRQFEQIAELAAAEAPGTVGFLQFLNSLASSATATSEPIPSDCAGTIAAVEEFLARGGSMQDLTMAELTRLGQLMTGVSDNCTAEESTAFFARDDLTAYLGT